MKHTQGELDRLKKTVSSQRIGMIGLCALTLISGYIAYRNYTDDRFKSTRYQYIDPLRQFVPASNYITNIQPLREYLAGIGRQYPEDISIYYENINSGANISINKDVRLFPASLSKLVQAILIAKKIEDKEWTWDTLLTALPEDISSDSGELYQKIGTTPMRVEDLLEELIVHSDNTAQNIFRHHLTAEDYIAFQNDTGLQDLYTDAGFISAKEYTRILRVLYTSNFLEPKHSEKILEYMSDATFRDYLSQGIPAGVEFAHKYGENKEYKIVADAGIVYVPDKPYMITVIFRADDATDANRAKAVALMKDISEHVYEASK